MIIIIIIIIYIYIYICRGGIPDFHTNRKALIYCHRHENVWGCPCVVMVKSMDCGIVVREFVLQSRYYFHFRANALGKGMNPLILPPMG